jgi:hypothetical protein
MIVDFPVAPVHKNRINARKRRRSKNGTPQERDAKHVAAAASVVKFRNPSDMRTEELVDRANENARRVASIVWPEITGLADHPQNLEELAGVEFDGIPEFRGDGIGVGTPEFRENLKAYFYTVNVAVKHALMVLGLSRSELVEAAEAMAVDQYDGANIILQIVHNGHDYLMRLAHYLRAAEVRQMCAITERDMKADGENETTTV